jgi:hypothetical protein
VNDTRGNIRVLYAIASCAAYNRPVPAQIVFLTLYLGLIAGRQPVDLQVGPDVKSVRILVDGREAAVVKAAPWSAIVDLGPAFEPRELVAIAFDRDGDEIGRTSQIINLPRPSAELTIGLQTDDKGIPLSVALRWEHVFAAKPSHTTISIDGQNVRVDEQLHARLPKVDLAHPHVIAAEMRFDDGFVARRELVITGGAVSDSIDTELTPVVFTGKLPGKHGTLDGCFSAHGAPVQTRAVETPGALVFVVREPNVREVEAALDPGHYTGRSWRESQQVRHRMPLDTGTTMRYTWPIVRRVEAAGHIPTNVFLTSATMPSSDVGMLGFLTLAYDAVTAAYPLRQIDPNNHRHFADAVAVAGINAITGAHRRAVVLVVDCSFTLSRDVDDSTAQPAAVRHYLDSVGVPLFVWSVSGPRPDLESSWGDVDDISTPAQFHAAVERLRASLASQHVAWIASDAIAALRVEADPRCGIVPLAHLGR